MEHKMKLWAEPFNKIKSGKKDIELRLNDLKRQLIKKGDYIIFTNNQTMESVRCEVVELFYYQTFEELYDKFDKTRLGYEEDEIVSPKDMEKFYLKDEISKYGVVGIQIKIVNE